MIAKILISQDLETRVGEIDKILEENQISNPHADLLYLNDEQKLGMAEAKKIREHLSLKPYSAKGRVVVLESAQKLTDEAQNSLLKTLEEPPEDAIILLGANSEYGLLPTILSRCQIITLNRPNVIPRETSEESTGLKSAGEKAESGDSSPTALNDKEIERIIDFNIEQRLEFVEKLEDKESLLKALLVFYRERLISDPQKVTFTKELLQAEEWLQAGVAIRPILEYLILKLT